MGLQALKRKRQIKKLQERSAIFSCGAAGYTAIELLWRGYTHWSMSITGGICFLLLYRLNTKLEHKSLVQKCALGSLAITIVEFVVGCIVNLGFKQGVWDYSDRPLNLLGQICLLYSILWFLLCIPLCFFTKFIRRKIFHRVS